MRARCSASRRDDVVFSAAKLFFAYGLGNALTFPLSVGATSVLMAERPTPAAVFSAWSSEQPTIFYGVPTLYAAMLASAEFPARDRLGLRLCVSAGEALPADIGKRWTRQYRRRHPRRHRLDRDAAHLPVQPARRRALRHDRQAGARLRAARRRRTGDPVATGEIGELQVSGPTSSPSRTGTIAPRAWRRFSGHGPAAATSTSSTPTATTSTAAAPTTCSRSAASTSRRSRSRRRWRRTRPCSKAAVVGCADAERAGQAEGLRRAQARTHAGARPRRGAAGRTSRRSSRPTSIRAGSSSSPTCRRPRPARSSASSCGHRRELKVRTDDAIDAMRLAANTVDGRQGRP